MKFALLILLASEYHKLNTGEYVADVGGEMKIVVDIEYHMIRVQAFKYSVLASEEDILIDEWDIMREDERWGEIQELVGQL